MTQNKSKVNWPSSTFCILPWIHLSTRPNGHLRLCCTANASSAGKTNDKEYGGEVGILKMTDGKPANLNVTDLMSAWNNQYMKDTRRQMLDGHVPHSCTKCFDEEAAGHRSKRQWETEYWVNQGVSIEDLLSDTGEDGTVPAKLYYIDLRPGTKCQLKCIMCSPHDSSAWIPDWNKAYPTIENAALKETMGWNNKGRENGASYNWHQDNPTFWTQLNEQIPHMKQLYFAGGEALIINEHYTLLREVIKQGYADKITLRYNSNGIEMPDELFELWSHFKQVRFHFSIDDIHARNDYIRYPAEWDTIETNLRRLDETPDNVEVTIACAVQALNIYYIPDFVKWKIEQNFKKINPYPLGAGLINWHFVYHPPHLNVKVLPNWFKDKVEAKYEEFYEWLKTNYRNDEDFLNSGYGINRMKGMVSFMKSDDWSNRMPEFREYLNKMDAVRGNSFVETFPEMADLMSDAEPVRIL